MLSGSGNEQGRLPSELLLLSDNGNGKGRLLQLLRPRLKGELLLRRRQSQSMLHCGLHQRQPPLLLPLVQPSRCRWDFKCHEKQREEGQDLHRCRRLRFRR